MRTHCETIHDTVLQILKIADTVFVSNSRLNADQVNIVVKALPRDWLMFFLGILSTVGTTVLAIWLSRLFDRALAANDEYRKIRREYINAIFNLMHDAFKEPDVLKLNNYIHTAINHHILAKVNGILNEDQYIQFVNGLVEFEGFLDRHATAIQIGKPIREIEELYKKDKKMKGQNFQFTLFKNKQK